jgi:hypothetical protein
VPLQDAEDTFFLAVAAAECVYGQARVRLDAGYCMDRDQRACVLDASTPVGQTINEIFAGFLAREFGRYSFHVERIEGPPPADELDADA